MSRSWRSCRLVALAVCLVGVTAARGTELLPEGRCPDDASAPASTEAPLADAIDATRPPRTLRTGAVIEHAALPSLRAFLPAEVWRHRDEFFFEGMRLTVGACHRRYPPSPPYAAASRTQAGRARLDAAGNLSDDGAGLPFAIASIEASATDAGARWAWNLERRDRGAGHAGSFRIVDLPDARVLSSRASPQVFEGTFFLAVSGPRVERTKGRAPASRGSSWVSGGAFREPPDARHLAWRQYRARETSRDATRPDDVFVYLPALRKVRRAASARSDGMFLPRYRIAGAGNARVVPYGQGGHLGTIEAGHGRTLAVAEDIERGFTGLALRPNAWTWRVVAERVVLAPLNTRNSGWPLHEGRNHGPSGLSLASDAWDVRLAVVIDGRARAAGVTLPRVTYWVDAQTAQPLYVIRRTASGALREVGILAHRYGGDDPRSPALPSGEPANAFDPVAAAFLTLPSGGWRRDSWDVRSLALDPDALRSLLSTDSLIRGR